VSCQPCRIAVCCAFAWWVSPFVPQAPSATGSSQGMRYRSSPSARGAPGPSERVERTEEGRFLPGRPDATLRIMGNVPWYLLGALGIAVAVEGVLFVGWWPLNVLAGVFLFNAAYALNRHEHASQAGEQQP
jgi:hypothetical protein